MAKFPIQRAQTTLAPTSGNVRANINVDTGEGEIGRAITNLGTGVANLGRRFDILEAKTQLSNSTVAATNEINAFFDTLKDNNDPDTYGDQYNKLTERLYSLAPTNKKAAALYRQDIAQQSLMIARNTRTAAKEKHFQQAQFSDLILFQSAKETGDYDKYKSSVLNNAKLGVYTAAQAQTLLDNAEKEFKIADVNNAVLEAFSVYSTTGDRSSALESLAKDDRISPSEKQEAESELTSRINYREAAQRKELEAKQDQQLEQINQLAFINGDYDSATKALAASDLDEKDKVSLFNTIDARARLAAKGTPIKNDRVEENRLYEMATNIWNGSVTKKQFDKELIANASKLDDEAYRRVATAATTTLKASQSSSLVRANTEALRQLVDFHVEDEFKAWIAASIKGKSPSEAKLFEDNANEKRQAQFRQLANYNAELRDWVEKNPDKTGREFYQFSRTLENEYRLAKESETTVEQMRQNQAIPVIKTKEEYDRLPSGTKYKTASGSISTKQ